MNVNRSPFDGFEVHLVAEYADPGSTNFCETVDTPDEYANAKEEAVAFMFTVYGHRTWPEDASVVMAGYGTTAISDFVIEDIGSDFERAHTYALDLAYALAAGRDIVHDFTPRITSPDPNHRHNPAEDGPQDDCVLCGTAHDEDRPSA